MQLMHMLNCWTSSSLLASNILAFRQRLLLSEHPGLDAHQLRMVANFDNQVADVSRNSLRLDANGPWRVVREERRAGQLRFAVHGHPAAAEMPMRQDQRYESVPSR